MVEAGERSISPAMITMVSTKATSASSAESVKLSRIYRASRKYGDRRLATMKPRTSRAKVIVSGRIRTTCQRGRGVAASSALTTGAPLLAYAHARALCLASAAMPR